MSLGQNKVDNNPIFYVVFFIKCTLHLVQPVCRVHWGFLIFYKSSFSKVGLTRRAARTFLVPDNLQDLGAWGDSGSYKDFPLSNRWDTVLTDDPTGPEAVRSSSHSLARRPLRRCVQISGPTACPPPVWCVRVCLSFHVFCCKSSCSPLHSELQRSVQRV